MIVRRFVGVAITDSAGLRGAFVMDVTVVRVMAVAAGVILSICAYRVGP
jgi:hypothetical protein